MSEKLIKELQKAIQNLYGCESKWIKSTPIKEEFEGETVWEGVVQVFDLQEHPASNRCYAWSHGLDNSDNRKFIAVLHQDPVDSPQAAVRAAIASEYHKKT